MDLKRPRVYRTSQIRELLADELGKIKERGDKCRIRSHNSMNCHSLGLTRSFNCMLPLLAKAARLYL